MSTCNKMNVLSLQAARSLRAHMPHRGAGTGRCAAAKGEKAGQEGARDGKDVREGGREGGRERDPSFSHESAATNILNLLRRADVARAARAAHAQGRASGPHDADLRPLAPKPHGTQPAGTKDWHECVRARRGGEQERKPQEPVHCLVPEWRVSLSVCLSALVCPHLPLRVRSPLVVCPPSGVKN